MSTAIAISHRSDRRRWIGLAALVASNLGLSAVCCLILNYEPPNPPPTFWEIVGFSSAFVFIFAQFAFVGSVAGATDDRRVRGGIALGLTVLFVAAMGATKNLESETLVVMGAVTAANVLAYSFAMALLARRLAGWKFSGESCAVEAAVRRKLSIKDLLVVTASVCLPLAAAQALAPGNVAEAAVSCLIFFAVIALIAIPWALAIAVRKRRLWWLLLALAMTIGPPLLPWTFVLVLRSAYMPRIMSDEAYSLWTERSWIWPAMLSGAALGTILAVIGNLLALQSLGLRWRRPVPGNRQA